MYVLSKAQAGPDSCHSASASTRIDFRCLPLYQASSYFYSTTTLEQKAMFCSLSLISKTTCPGGAVPSLPHTVRSRTWQRWEQWGGRSQSCRPSEKQPAKGRRDASILLPALSALSALSFVISLWAFSCGRLVGSQSIHSIGEPSSTMDHNPPHIPTVIPG